MVKFGKRKIITVIISILVVFVVFISGYVIFNVPLRTAIYRNFAKQTVYLYTDGDTIYSFGYFGVRKYVTKDKELKLLAENDEFCNNCFVGHLIGRSGLVKDGYLYVSARCYVGGQYSSEDNGFKKGELLVFDKSDLRLVNALEADYTMIETAIHDSLLVVSGLQGFNIYNINKPENPKLISKYRSNYHDEYQGLKFIANDTTLLLAFSRFSDGLSIFDITDPNQIIHKADYPIENIFYNGEPLPKGLQTFTLIYDKPYIYASLGPVNYMFGKNCDRRGIIRYDFTNIDSVHTKVSLIPSEDFYSTKTGDPQPSHIKKYKNKIYANFGEKGVAVFDVSTDSMIYEGVINAANGKMILPIDINDKGILLMGDFNSPEIYEYNLN